MKMYMTSGTADFMETVRQKHKKHEIFIMHGEGNTLLLHESDKKSVFATPRNFEVIQSNGTLEQKGFFALHNVPVSDESRLLFEQRYMKQQALFEDASGLIAYRFLRPIKHETYILLTQWAGPASYERWQQTDSYTQLFGGESSTGIANTQILFMSKPYVTKYTAKPLEENV
ncbi:antibiotic biosynthesis monooxygenase family protein [Caryophanon tenue]|uniref:ABM domain-containing protein n=1 Tax=Caryophanon tenue TaxID=33978 RepID=A0A1C0YJC2_9BACL|nr:antibiotic biosynthesis monooxygenase [Caryophanon tenue]OCS87234.1 hypothetical protein A6M13_11430 [Caryophanon tenue]